MACLIEQRESRDSEFYDLAKNDIFEHILTLDQLCAIVGLQ